MKNKIYTLNNNKDYYIIEELDYENKKYVLAIQCNLKNDTINEDELDLFEVVKEDNNISLKEVSDNPEKILGLLLKKYNEN